MSKAFKRVTEHIDRQSFDRVEEKKICNFPEMFVMSKALKRAKEYMDSQRFDKVKEKLK